MDWNPLHSSLFSGAGTPWGAVDTRPSWAVGDPKLWGFDFNIDPRYSAFFREVQLPAAQVIGVAAAVILTGGAAAAGLGVSGGALAAGSVGAGLGMSAGVATGFATGAGLAAGAGAGALWNMGEKQLGITKGTGAFAVNADKVGLILGAGWLAANPPGSNDQPVTYPEVKQIATQIAAVTTAPAGKPPIRTAAGFAPGTPSGPSVAQAPSEAPKMLFLGVLALAAIKMA